MEVNKMETLGTPVLENPNGFYVLKVETPIEYKITLKNAWLHFKKICIHKYWVAYYCFKAGLYWQGITHDLSKFSWIEFWESVKYYQGTKSPIDACKADKGYSLAWQHHKGRNPHHYEYWTDKYDDGTVALEMPFKYAVELLCDWLGAGRAYNTKSNFTYKRELDWWINKRDNTHPKMHERVLNFVDIVFHCLEQEEEMKQDPLRIFNENTLHYYYTLALRGNFEYWKEFDKKMYERSVDDAKRAKEDGFNIDVYYLPTLKI